MISSSRTRRVPAPMPSLACTAGLVCGASCVWRASASTDPCSSSSRSSSRSLPPFRFRFSTMAASHAGLSRPICAAPVNLARAIPTNATPKPAPNASGKDFTAQKFGTKPAINPRQFSLSHGNLRAKRRSAPCAADSQHAPAAAAIISPARALTPMPLVGALVE